MENIFARDILNVVIRRKIKTFQLENDSFQHLPTPFCFRIRRAVEHYLTNEDLEIYYAVTDFMVSMPDFKALVAYQREHVIPTVGTLVDLLKHLSLLSMMAAWYKRFGDENAPTGALEEITRLLVDFASKYDHPDIFWRRLRHAAPYIMTRPLTNSERLFVRRMNFRRS